MFFILLLFLRKHAVSTHYDVTRKNKKNSRTFGLKKILSRTMCTSR